MKNTHIGWIGAGSLGSAMVENLCNKGYNVAIYNRTKGKAQKLLDKGAVWCESPSVLAEKTDIIFICVGNFSALNEVLLNGIINAQSVNFLNKKHTIIDFTTSSPADANIAKEVFSKIGVEYLECPVSGGSKGALKGSLSMIVSGKEQTFLNHKHLLMDIAKDIHFVKESGRAQALKILNNIAESVNLLGAIEVLVAGSKLGLTLSDMEKAFMSCRGRSAYMQVAIDFLKEGRSSSEVSLEIRCKDLDLAEILLSGIDDYHITKYTKSLFESVRNEFGPTGDQCDYFKVLEEKLSSLKTLAHD